MAQVSRLGSETVAKVAKIISGTPEDVGEVITTAYNNLESQPEGTTSEKVNHIGDLIACTSS